MGQFQVIDGVVSVGKEITKLDEFVLKTIRFIKQRAEYVIISGYVSIFFGRARATEDVDIFIKSVTKEDFCKLYEEMVQNGYEWTIDNCEELYNDYLLAGLSICVWEKDFPLLRIEMKYASKLSQLLAFKDKIIVKFKDEELFMGSIEQQIAYKKYIAKSDKDLADAKHLELVFKDLNLSKIQEYRKLFEEEFRGLY